MALLVKQKLLNHLPALRLLVAFRKRRDAARTFFPKNKKLLQVQHIQLQTLFHRSSARLGKAISDC